MNNWLRLLVAVIFAPSSVCTAYANDLLRLYDLALQQDAAIQSSTAQRDAAIEVKPQAWAVLFPQLAMTASGARERITSNDPLVLGSTVGTATDHPAGYTLGLSQSIIDFGTFSRVREAGRLAASAEVQLDGAQQELMTRTADAYFDLLAARDLLATARSEREAYRTLLEQAKNREQTGVGPRSAVEQVQSYYDATAAQVIATENNLDDARLAMARIVGEPVTDVAMLRDDIPLAAPVPASVDEWIRTGLVNNPALKSAALKAEAAQYEIGVQTGKALPTISLTASQSRAWQKTYPGDETLNVIGISFSMPLFQGGEIRSHIRQSHALYRQAHADYETVTRETESGIRAAYRGVVTSIQRIDAARRAVDSARAAVDASRRNVEFGTGTEFDLLTAQNNYSVATSVLSQSRYDYFRNSLELKRQAGELTKQDLVTVDNLLVQQ